MLPIPRFALLPWLAAAALAAHLAPAAAAQCGQDTFEPNNSCSAARPISSPFIQTGLAVYRLSDPDYFSITLAPGDQLDADVFFSDAAGDIDLFLYDANGSCGGPFTFLDISNSSSDDESVRITNVGSAPMDLILKVELFPGELVACNNYDIAVTVAPPNDPCSPAANDDPLEPNDDCQGALPLPMGTTQDLWVSREDGDFFSTTVQAGETLVVEALFTDSVADIDLFLYDAAGPCGTATVNSGELVNSFTQTDDERIAWSNTTGAPLDVILHVDIFGSQTCNTYDLVVSSSGGGVGTNYCTAVPNSTGQIGLIQAQGSASVAANSMTLVATQLPPQQFGLLLASRTQGFVANAGGSNGNLCLAGDVGRFNQDIMNGGANGTISIPVDLTAVPQPSNFASVAPGETWRFQLWHRDAGNASNFTNGVRITFQN